MNIDFYFGSFGGRQMSKSFLIRGMACCVLYFVVMMSTVNTAWSADPVTGPGTVPDPCLTGNDTKSPRIDLQSCSYLLDDKSPTKFMSAYTTFFQTQIDCFYQGYVGASYDANKPQVCSNGTPLTKDSQGNPPVTCSYADQEGIMKDNPDNWPVNSKNHLGQDCGNTDNNTGSEGQGVWEKTHFSGLWVQAVKYFSNQIKSEIMVDKKLKIHPRCQAMATDYLQLLNKSKDLSSQVIGNVIGIPDNVYTGGVNFCSNDSAPFIGQVQTPTGVVTIDLAAVIPKAASCYMAIARDNLVSLFGFLAKCELSARVDIFRLVTVPGKTAEWYNFTSKCRDDAERHGKHVGESELSESAGKRAGKKYFNNCYRPKIQEFFKSFGTSLQNQVNRQDRHPYSERLADFSGVGFLIGSVETSRRRRKQFIGWFKKLLGFFSVNFLILGVFTYLGWGSCCSGGGGAPDIQKTFIDCTYRALVCDGEPPCPDEKSRTCCDPAGPDGPYQDKLSSVVNDRNLCAQCDALCALDATADVGGAISAGSVQQAQQTAAQMISGSPGSPASGTPVDNSGTAAGATAGDTSLGNTGSQGPAKSGVDTYGGRLKGDDSSGAPSAGGRSSGVQSGGGGDPGTFQDTTGNSNSNGTGSTSSDAAGGGMDDPSKSAYSSGGGSAAATAGAAGGSLFGGSNNRGLAGAGAGAGTDTQTFGSQDSINPMAGADPSDYFTRLGLDMSIFKAVHDRYQVKASFWQSEILKKKK